MLQFMGSQRVGHDWATELNWMSNNVETSFHVLICHLYILFGGISISVFALFLIRFFYIVGFDNPLHILDTGLLLHMRFANVFSHSVAFLLIVSWVLEREEVFKFSGNSMYHFFLFMGHAIFPLISHDLGFCSYTMRFKIK